MTLHVSPLNVCGTSAARSSAMTFMPAATPAFTPTVESSTTTQSAGETLRSSAALRNPLGLGLPASYSPAPRTSERQSSMPHSFAAATTSSCGEPETIAHGAIFETARKNAIDPSIRMDDGFVA